MTASATQPIDPSTLISTLTASLSTSTESIAPTSTTINPSGISLLDLKNEIFLSYLHHLSFLFLFRVRNGSIREEDSEIGKDLVEKLAELRVWLERGVKPCENKLKYQVEKVLRAAYDWERQQGKKKSKQNSRRVRDDDGEDEEITSESGDDARSGDEDNDEEITSESEIEEDLPKTTNYDSDDLNHPEKSGAVSAASMKNALSYRPNPAALAKSSTSSLPTSKDPAALKDGIYRPPRINPTSLPELSATTPSMDLDRRSKFAKQQKSHAIDEFLSEYTGAPSTEASIGSTIAQSGRKSTTARERKEEAERREYEEANFVRLPKMSKKEMREKAKRDGGGKQHWGGEDWAGIERGMGLDRIDRLTKKRDESGQMLQRSRKRGGEFTGEGGERMIGERFEKRRKLLDRKGR